MSSSSYEEYEKKEKYKSRKIVNKCTIKRKKTLQAFLSKKGGVWLNGHPNEDSTSGNMTASEDRCLGMTNDDAQGAI